MQDFKQLAVWRKSHEFVLLIYQTVSCFPQNETYNLVSQLKRASSSIAANIAEGSGRYTSRDFANFLQNALGSSHEIEYFLLLSKDLKYLSSESFEELNCKINEIKAMLISLIKRVRESSK